MNCPRCKGLAIETTIQMQDMNWQPSWRCMNCGWYQCDPDQAARDEARRDIEKHEAAVQASLKRAGEKRRGHTSQPNPQSPWRRRGLHDCGAEE